MRPPAIAALLDAGGNWVPYLDGWFPNENEPVTTDPKYQSWNDLTYNQTNGEYLVAWNDWRMTSYTGIEVPAPAADIFAQRLYLNPLDSALIWVDDRGAQSEDRATNIMITDTRSPDEGNQSYPAPTYSIAQNEYFIAYEYDMPANDDSIDVHATYYAGLPFSAGLAEIVVTPAEVYLNPGDQQQFEGHGFDADGYEIYVKIIWSAKGGNIDTDTGLYEATVEGEFTVTASVEGSAVTGTAAVYVNPADVDQTGTLPTEFGLSQNYPNPFNPETVIQFGVKHRCRVELTVYDLQGHEISTLVNRDYAPGTYRVTWDATGHASGIYLYRIRMGDFEAVKRMILIE